VSFSIAMATYNGARFLREQLSSLAEQTVLPAELVVCDDGSRDETLAILAAFATRAPFAVRVESNPGRLGASGNFLRAASLCRQEWIAYCDQDDFWLPNKLAAVQQVVARHPKAMLVAHRATLVDEALRPLGGMLHVPAVKRFTVVPRLSRSFWEYPYGFTMTFHSRLLGVVPVTDRPVESHDRWIALLAGLLGETVYLPQSLALYRRHSHNVSQLHPQASPLQTLQQGGSFTEFSDAAQLMDALAKHIDASVACAGAEDAVRLAEAALAFRRQSVALERRAELSRADVALPHRIGCYTRLLAAGGYGSNRCGGLGWRAALKDAVRLVIHRPGARSVR
jgi:hypothetical protein